MQRRLIGNAKPAIWESGGPALHRINAENACFHRDNANSIIAVTRKLPRHVGARFVLNLGQSVPTSTSRTMAHQMSLVHKRGYVIFYGVSACAGCFDDVADRDMTAFAAEFKNLYR
jgi:hypothetical protein